MENLEIKEVTIEKTIASIKLIWDTMKEFDQINNCMKDDNLAKKYFIEELVDDYLDGELFLIGAYINGEVVGIIGSKENYINFFFVKKEYQKKKIGKKLMVTMLEYLQQKEIEKVEVGASKYAHDIYKHLGFSDIVELKQDTNEYPMIYELRRK